MADNKRRDFLQTQLGTGVVLGTGLLTGGAVGAAAAVAHARGSRHPYAELRAHSYAQQGEDIVLWNILAQFLALRPITYLDVGAHHPVQTNNTYLFYERGNSGVLVEPNPTLWDALAGLRPRDALIRGGIGVDGKDSEADYYMINNTNGDLNTFSKEMAESYSAKSGGKFSIQQVVRMPLVDINGVMQKYWGGAPHLLSLDTEGFELPILRSIDWKRFRPAVICVDTIDFGSRKQRGEILKFVAAQGYDLRGATFVNSIYVDRALL
jgi:FkbM family methyltransferase